MSYAEVGSKSPVLTAARCWMAAYRIGRVLGHKITATLIVFAAATVSVVFVGVDIDQPAVNMEIYFDALVISLCCSKRDALRRDNGKRSVSLSTGGGFAIGRLTREWMPSIQNIGL